MHFNISQARCIRSMLGSSISKLQFPTYYKTGKSNIEPDALSRIPWYKTKSDYQDLDHLTVKAIIGGCTTENPLVKDYMGK